MGHYLHIHFPRFKDIPAGTIFVHYEEMNQKHKGTFLLLKKGENNKALPAVIGKKQFQIPAESRVVPVIIQEEYALTPEAVISFENPDFTRGFIYAITFFPGIIYKFSDHNNDAGTYQASLEALATNRGLAVIAMDALKKKEAFMQTYILDTGLVRQTGLMILSQEL